jgi:AbrB family looped-hinge helix DNA binding protein
VTKPTVTSKGQTTVPRNIREKLHISTGDVLMWEADRDMVCIRVANSGFLRRRGSIRVGEGSIAEDLAQVRSTRGRTTK